MTQSPQSEPLAEANRSQTYVPLTAQNTSQTLDPPLLTLGQAAFLQASEARFKPIGEIMRNPSLEDPVRIPHDGRDAPVNRRN